MRSVSSQSTVTSGIGITLGSPPASMMGSKRRAPKMWSGAVNLVCSPVPVSRTAMGQWTFASYLPTAVRGRAQRHELS